ncbi:MAG: hypothetical protein GY913_13140 [Proteobacteria bacterium]|nr:hypothetical protein [Pseudomonadota bacterium]
MLLLTLACTQSTPTDSTPDTVPWTADRPFLDLQVRGRHWARGIIHVHSPWSHDACDGEIDETGEFSETCLADFRAGFCRTGMDFAYVTDHPSHAAYQDYDELKLAREDDEVLSDGVRMSCGTVMMPGIEDTVMPVGFSEHLPGTEEERDHLYNQSDADALAAFIEAGALVLQNHPEGLEREVLLERRDAGQIGLEIFNLHAMFAPDIRSEDLGLDSFGWVEDIRPFTEGSAEPDLLFLAVHQDQPPSLDHWDALLELGPTVGIGGTDAHQNVLDMELEDGERVDSYRRMMSWFSNWLLVDEATPAGFDEALSSARNALVFEALGTPAGLDVHLGDAELGEVTSGGTLSVGCVGLAESSPRGTVPPELRVEVRHDGTVVGTECGDYEATAGVWRVSWYITPHHLADFLGPDDVWSDREFPWIHTGAITVR